MMRNVLVCLLVGLSLAGCMDTDDASTDDAGVTEVPAEAEEPTVYEPVEVHVEDELTDGYPQEVWRFEVGPDATGRILFEIRGLVAGANVATDYCFVYRTVRDTGSGVEEDSGNRCMQGGFSIGVSGGSPETLYHASEILPGEYEFRFRAGQSPSVFMADIIVEYR